jgi:SAM-dependent methyltransferase
MSAAEPVRQASAGSDAFDYEARRWGSTAVQARPWYLQGLKLRYALDDLAGVQGACLDVGCGGGNMARAIKRERPDLRVTGVDLSRSAIDAARRYAGGVEFTVTPATGLPFEPASFEAVVMFDVLEHVEDPVSALADIARVLKPAGVFHLALPLEGQRGTIYPWLARRGWTAKRRHAGHIQAFDDAGFRRMAAAAGLQVRLVHWSFHPLFALVDILYYVWLDLGGPVGHSVEDGLALRRGPARMGLTALARAVSSIGWYESRLLRWMPGACGHYTCVRVAE